MPSPPSVWAHAGFALGYAEDGTFPVPDRAQRECSLLQEHSNAQPHPHLMRYVIEAGRKEGRRTAREGAHRALYAYHKSAISELWAGVLAKLDKKELPEHLALIAAHEKGAGTKPLARRHTVAAATANEIRAVLTSDQHHKLDQANADGYAHGWAHGRAEVQATPKRGGPPDPKKVGAAALAGLELAPKAVAQYAATKWTEDQLNAIAMGAAFAAGDGHDLGVATRAVKQALIDTGRATWVYGNEMHATVMQSFVDHVQVAYPDRQVDFVTESGNPCPVCEGYEADSPYEPSDVPLPPIHWHCMCVIELASDSALVAA